MTSVFPTMIAILIGLSFEEFYVDTAMPEEALGWLLLALSLCLLPVLSAEILFWIARRSFERGHPYEIRSYARYVAALPLPLYALIIFGFGWPKIVVPLGLERTILLDHLVVLAPYFLLLGCSLVQAARLRRPMRVGPRGPVPATVADVRAVVFDTCRQLGLMLVPLLGLILLLDLARETALSLYFDHLPLVSAGFLLFSLFALAAFYPDLFRLGLGLKPLVAGAPLRRRLEEMAAHLNFKCRDILCWSTRRPVLNAAIVGILPAHRYVILTEELCKRLTLEELGAVFAHEVGHGKRHHALIYMLFSLAFLTALVPLGDWVGGAVLEWTGGRIDASLAAAICVYMPAFAFYWVVLFGKLSRRFELEADVFGVEVTRDPDLFITTLEKVARIGRIERRQRTTRHFSIAGRTDFLRRAFIERQPQLLAGFRKRLRVIRRTILWSSAVVLLGSAGWLSLESLRGMGAIFLERGRDAKAIRVLAAVLRLHPSDAVACTLLAEAGLYKDLAPDGDGERNWRVLSESRSALGPLQRSMVLTTLRVGWARAVARRRYDAALTLLRRARQINQIGGDEKRRFFDFEMVSTLFDMESVTKALQMGVGARIEQLSDHPPRWLRRADVKKALDSLRNWRAERNDL